MGFDSVDELDSLDDIGQEFVAVEHSPAFAGREHELVDHREAG